MSDTKDNEKSLFLVSFFKKEKKNRRKKSWRKFCIDNGSAFWTEFFLKKIDQLGGKNRLIFDSNSYFTFPKKTNHPQNYLKCFAIHNIMKQINFQTCHLISIVRMFDINFLNSSSPSTFRWFRISIIITVTISSSQQTRLNFLLELLNLKKIVQWMNF